MSDEKIRYVMFSRKPFSRYIWAEFHALSDVQPAGGVVLEEFQEPNRVTMFLDKPPNNAQLLMLEEYRYPTSGNDLDRS